MTFKIVITVILVYLICINITASIITVQDKRKAVKGKWRISEKCLLLLGLFGGAAGEYFTMLKIRHKTKHAKFMIGLPLEIFLHIILIVLIIYKVALC